MNCAMFWTQRLSERLGLFVDYYPCWIKCTYSGKPQGLRGDLARKPLLIKDYIIEIHHLFYKVKCDCISARKISKDIGVLL